jgi:hypothetical protein
MPANRKDRRLTGSFKPSQAAPELVYSKPPPGELNDAQRALLKLRPKRLTQSQKLEYRRKVIDAPWLTAGDRELLVQWVQARTRYELTSKAFTGLLVDPLFAQPGSAVARAASEISRLCHRETAVLINLAQRLGFSPNARNSLGLKAKPAPADANDPWEKLRLVRQTPD